MAEAEAAGEQSVIERLTTYIRQSENPEPESAETQEQPAEEESEVSAQAEDAADESEATQQEPETEVEAEQADSSTPVTTKVKVRGDDGQEEEVDVTHDELVRGYQRQADYTRKTQQLKAAQAESAGKIREVAEAAQRELAQYEAMLHMMVAPELQGVDMMRLAAEDPAEHVRLSARASQIHQARETLRAAAARLDQQRMAALNQVVQQEIEVNAAKLPKLIPGWNETLRDELVTRAQKTYGFTSEELSAVTNARALQVLHDAHQYRKLQEAKQSAIKKQVKPTAPAPKAPARPAVKGDFEKLRDRYRKSGEADDWVAAYQAKRSQTRK